MPDDEHRTGERVEGRTLACEGILRSRFGRRRCSAGDRALEELREAETAASAGGPDERRPHAIRWGAWISVAACLAIIVGALVYNARQEERFVEVMVARIRKTSPEVEVFRAADGKTVVAVVGMDLQVGDRIETKKGESADTDTAIRIGDTKEGKRLHLQKGILDASVAPQPEDQHMIITTPHARAEVKGTRFSLLVQRRYTRIDVVEGVVGFTRLVDDSSIEVTAGQFALAGEKAEAFALKTYTNGTEWVDGPVVFEDDFDAGLDRWERMSVIREKGGRISDAKSLGPAEASFVRITETHRNGRAERVLLLDGTRITDRRRIVAIGIRPALPSDLLHWSCEYDKYLVPVKGKSYSVFPAEGRPHQIKGEDGVAGLVERWYRARREQLSQTIDGKPCQIVTVYRDGRAMGRLVLTGVSSGVRLHVTAPTNGKCMVDKVVIRRMVRVEGKKEDDRIDGKRD
jgi:hypothetical protein